MVDTKEIANELLKAILPKIQDLQTQINDLNKRMDIVHSDIQTLHSILINQRKHGN